MKKFKEVIYFDNASWNEYLSMFNPKNWSKEDYRPKDILGEPKKEEWAGLHHLWTVISIIVIIPYFIFYTMYVPIKYLSCWRRKWVSK